VRKRSWETEGTLVFAQRAAVQDALQTTGHCITRAAERLRVSRSTVYRLMQCYEILSPVRDESHLRKIEPQIGRGNLEREARAVSYCAES
jgi:hypothetical protein